jgi:hypothetical protein
MVAGKRIAAACAVACFAGAVALTPSEVRSRIEPRLDGALAPAVAPVTPIAVVVPQGDPFAPRASEDVTGPPVAANAERQDLAALDHLGPLPPNAGAIGSMALVAPVPVRLTAVVVGAHRGALVDDGSGPRVVTAGDRIAGTTVASIDARGVTLGDGRRLTLPATTRP